jgi:FAD synthase
MAIQRKVRAVRAALHGTVRRPATIIVGTWDPLLPDHLELFARLSGAAHQNSRDFVVVMLDPAPPLLRWGLASWAVYDGASIRQHLIRQAGSDAVLRIRFAKRDLDATAAQFLTFVGSHLTFTELSLGDGQILGNGPEGAEPAIARYMAERGMLLRHLPPTSLTPTISQVRALLSIGRVRRAREIVGRPPTWTRPPAGALRLAWRPGTYHAVPLSQPTGVPHTDPIAIELTPQARGLPRMCWPPLPSRYIAFIAGPADSPD